MKGKNLWFALSLIGIILLSELFSPSPQATLKIMGILFASSYLLFYAGEITVFWYTIQAERAIRKNDLERVKDLYRRIHKISPGSLSGKTALAILHSMRGEWRQAEKLYREVLRSRPSDTRLQYNLAISLVHQGEYEEPLQSLTLILKLYPGWSIAYSAVGEIYLAQENFELAYQYFKVALVLDRCDRSALRHLPLVCEKLELAA